ncbi:hypothetical protein [Nocardioides cynanchi]|uniref:hypothetical protein n=1 Tax=Nocardioides cynanchi TaxID=2558918 RepID=UPI001244AC71|nr:hypothetical protein [Nocardioides cynanchi]
MGLFSLDQIANLGAELKELYVDVELIHDITADLTQNEDAVHDSGFQKYHVDQAVFGESSLGGSLGYHHSLAHAKVSDTLAAVLQDLHTFRLGLATFAKAVDTADTQSAADLAQRHHAIEQLAQAAGFEHTSQRNHYYHPAEHTGGTHA